MAEAYNVATYDESEAKLDKTPNSYNDFVYDNETDGGILDQFSSVNTKIGEVRTNIESLHQRYEELKGMYEEFTHYNDSMDAIIRTMNGRLENIESSYKNILTTAQQAVEENMATDTTLMDDLDEINSLLNGGDSEAGMRTSNENPYNYTDEQLSHLSPDAQREYAERKAEWENNQFKESHGGLTEDQWNHIPDSEKQKILQNQAEISQKGKIVSDTDATEAGFTMGKSLDEVTDEIIQGKYGTGPDRFAELEKQGYNVRDVKDANGNVISRGLQDIVNEKMNGTYVKSDDTTAPYKLSTNTPSANSQEAAFKQSHGGLSEEAWNKVPTTVQNEILKGVNNANAGSQEAAFKQSHGGLSQETWNKVPTTVQNEILKGVNGGSTTKSTASSTTSTQEAAFKASHGGLTQETWNKVPTTVQNEILKGSNNAQSQTAAFKSSHGGLTQETWNKVPSSVQHEILKNVNNANKTTTTSTSTSTTTTPKPEIANIGKQIMNNNNGSSTPLVDKSIDIQPIVQPNNTGFKIPDISGDTGYDANGNLKPLGAAFGDGTSQEALKTSNMLNQATTE